MEEIWKVGSLANEDLYMAYRSSENRTVYRITFPLRKRVWRLFMLLLRGWCYWD